MTLIYTQAHKYGIILAADSNLTSDTGSSAGVADKGFTVPYLNAGLCVAGSYSFGGVPMDHWMPAFIAAYAGTKAPSLAGFASTLRDRLEAGMTAKEKDNLCLVQLAGYVPDAAGHHPEFYFIRNIEDDINPTDGSYRKGAAFRVDEQLWWRDLKEQGPRDSFLAGITAHFYVNGYPHGRIAFTVLMNQLGEFLKSTWANPGWKFRGPNALAEQVEWIKLQFQVIDTLFKNSNYPARLIGGPVWTLGIPPP